MDFYNYYLSLCQNLGMKPSPAGEAAGFSRTAVNGWKKGHLPTDSNLLKLAEFFNVPISEFYKCNDIKERDIKANIARMKDEYYVLAHGEHQDEGKKNTVTKSDGNQILEGVRTERDELKRLIDRLTDEEVHSILEQVKSLIFGI